MTLILMTVAFVAGVAFAAFRLRGEGSTLSALRRILPYGGGGPGGGTPPR